MHHTAIHDASCPLRILKIVVRGGLSNQKECLVNAGIVAHALGVTLALPHFDLVGRGNERFEPENAAYVRPYADRSRWGHFSHLFNATSLSDHLKGSLDVLVRPRAAISVKPRIVHLPPIENLTNGCAGFKRMHETCEAAPGDPALLETLIRAWRNIIDDDCKQSRKTHALNGSSVGHGAVVFNADQSLCWNAYKSRHATRCVRQYPFCAKMLHSLRWNRVIIKLQSRVLQGIARTINQTATRNSWAAVHVRAFVCARDNRKPTFDHVATALQGVGVHSGVVYVVSSVPVDEVQRALPGFTVLSKTAFLGAEVSRRYPFEVLAAIDYGVAVAAPHYLGEPSASSFDAFALEDRQRQHLTITSMESPC